MGPTSLTLVWLLALAALAAVGGVGYLIWHARTRGHLPRRADIARSVALGVALTVVAQLSAVAAIAIEVNRNLGIYLDWSAVGGAMTGQGGLAEQLGVGGDPSVDVKLSQQQQAEVKKQGWYPAKSQPAKGDGSFRYYSVAGARSKLHKYAVVWVPPGVTDRYFPRLPVVMTLSGAYGGPLGFLQKANFAHVAASMIRAHQVPKFIVVAPMVNVDMPNDTECVDYPGGPQAFTWLAEDVRTWAHQELRVSLARSAWTVEGMSTGGYCAAKLAAARPDAFSAGASVMGYFEPEPDATTLNLGSLLQSNATVRQQASVAWLIANHTATNQAKVVAVSSSSDPQSFPQFDHFRSQVGSDPRVTFLDLPRLAHTNSSFGLAQDRVLRILLKP